MATLIDPDFRARLNALNDKYAAGVPALMAAIDAALQDCARQGPQPVSLALLQKHLHTVAGSAATFGFGVLGQQARELEQRLRRLTAPQAGESAEADWPALAADVGHLLRWAAIDPKAASYDAPAV